LDILYDDTRQPSRYNGHAGGRLVDIQGTGTCIPRFIKSILLSGRFQQVLPGYGQEALEKPEARLVGARVRSRRSGNLYFEQEGLAPKFEPRFVWGGPGAAFTPCVEHTKQVCVDVGGLKG
jgi:hypothetical protein